MKNNLIAVCFMVSITIVFLAGFFLWVPPAYRTGPEVNAIVLR